MADWDPVVVRNPSTVFPEAALGVTLAAGAGAWDPLPASAEIVAAGDVPAVPYVVDALCIDTVSALGVYLIQLYYRVGAGADVECGAVKVHVLASLDVLPLRISSGPIPGGAAIRGAIASNNAAANTLNVTPQFRAL